MHCQGNDAVVCGGSGGDGPGGNEQILAVLHNIRFPIPIHGDVEEESE